MFRLIQITLPGALFFLIILQYKEVERLKADNNSLRARLHQIDSSPDKQVQEALQLAAQGKKEEAVSRLKTVTAEFPATPAAKEAQAKAAQLEVEASRARALQQARVSSEQNKKDLEKMLEIAPPAEKAPPKPPEPVKELQVASCRKLESDSNKYAGKKIVITDSIEQLDKYFNFTECSGIRISTERLDRPVVAALQAKLAGKDSASVTLAGEYSGLVFYLERVK